MRILLIDSYNMIHRSRFGWAKGEHSTTFTFFRSLRSEIERHKPNKVYIVSEGRPQHRLAINPDYKGNREKIDDDGFHRQKDDIFNLCKHLPVTIIRHQDYECDDVIAHLALHVHKEHEVVICSSDTDFIQLLTNKNISLWNPVKKSFIKQWPVDYLIWKSLRGDKTDNIPGIKGVGDKTAMKLAADKSLLDEYLSVGDRLSVYKSAMSQIKLGKIADNNFQQDDYNFDCKTLHEQFSSRGFKSIVEKSWRKWTMTMENVR